MVGASGSIYGIMAACAVLFFPMPGYSFCFLRLI